MRYVYVKSGEAVDEVRRALQGQRGPDVYVEEFLRAHASDELLILCFPRPRRETFVSGSLRAEGYPAEGPGILGRLRGALRVGAVIYRWRPDRILCGCMGEMLWVSTLVAKLLGVAIVNARHGSLVAESWKQRVARILERASIRRCDGVVCHGPYITQEMRALGVPPSRTFQFGVDFREFAASGTASPPPQVVAELARRFDHVFLFAGRVQRDKGVIDLLEAYCDLPAETQTRTALVYAGDGKDMPLLRQYVTSRQLEARVLLLGDVPHRQLASIMRMASVVVTPTRPEFAEGRCKVVAESLVLGVPVIAPNFGPFPYGIRHGVDGLLFEAGNRRALAECLSRVAREEQLLQRLRAGAQASAQRIANERSGFAYAIDCAFTAATSRAG